MSKKHNHEPSVSHVEMRTTELGVDDPVTTYVEMTTTEVIDEVEDVVTEVEEDTPEVVKGVVVGCTKLNIRKEPNSSSVVVGTVATSTEMVLDETESTDDFYKVCTAAGVEGFCMKKFISIIK